MHELSLASNIINIVSSELKKRSISFNKLKTVKIIVGRLMQVVPDSLLYALKITGKEIGFYDTAYEINIKPVEIKCPNCGIQFTAEKFDIRCPDCGCLDVIIAGGREFLIDKIIINDD